ncbi:glycosyltransferase [Marisediminicola senii]|uniref:glycosyltransferase n=1 Tax=Marisediminicola senii TaxID=2711233 RepID=UPI0013EBE93D|nr:glycosyltransferase [Marisediminicola senii]
MSMRVAAVPTDHPYVRNLRAEPDDAAVRYLAEEYPSGAEPGRWWPPVRIDPRWIAAHDTDFDVLHVHFGTESFDLAHLERTVDALAAAGRPLVFTVHDLTNPQLHDQADHLAQLDLLVTRAAAVITLTPGAAAEVARRWGRDAVVIAHPHVLPIDGDDNDEDNSAESGADAVAAVAATAAPAPRGAAVVGMHLKDLRAGVDGVAAASTLLGAIEVLRAAGHDVVARIELADRVRDDAARDEIRALCASDRALAARVELVEHGRYSDAELFAALSGLDAYVLPYRHGTHSGWLELCWDLGLPVAVPAVGFIAEQHDDPAFCQSFAMSRPGTLATALDALLGLSSGMDAPRAGSPARRRVRNDRRSARRRERQTIADRHRDVYRAALAGPVPW